MSVVEGVVEGVPAPAEAQSLGLTPFINKLFEIITNATVDDHIKWGPRGDTIIVTDPVIFALANPTPEIMPELARAARPDAIIGTGRSDYPNQVNNVLCFPYLFRGALDVGGPLEDFARMRSCGGVGARRRRLQPGFGRLGRRRGDALDG